MKRGREYSRDEGSKRGGRGSTAETREDRDEEEGE